MCEFCLSTTRCTISDVSGPDLEALWQTLDDADTQRFLPKLCQEFPTEDSLHLLVFPILLSQINKNFECGKGFFWSIRRGETCIGFVALMDMTTHPTLFYATHPDYRCQGYMKECLLRVIEFAKKKYLFPKVYTEVYPENVISQTLLVNVGFCKVDEKDGKYYYEMIIYEEEG